jgi:2-hydroxychromene-2-carboxylate isomerase
MAHVQLYYDYASPWSYLASELIATRLPGARVEWKPIYLRGLEAFSRGVPYGRAKLRYSGLDLMRCAAHEQVPLRFPSEFPVNGLYAVRAALALLDTPAFADYHRAMFRAVWRDDRKVADNQVVLDIAAEAGLDRASLAEAIEAPATKERLKQETAAAEARGVFGVPAFFVGDELFWGHDRMDYVARALKLV